MTHPASVEAVRFSGNIGVRDIAVSKLREWTSADPDPAKATPSVRLRKPASASRRRQMIKSASKRAHEQEIEDRQEKLLFTKPAEAESPNAVGSSSVSLGAFGGKSADKKTNGKAGSTATPGAPGSAAATTEGNLQLATAVPTFGQVKPSTAIGDDLANAI